MGYFWAANGQAPAEEGGIAGVVSAGSGVALDDPGSSGIAPGKGGVNTVDYVADPSGVQAVGLLLHAIEAEPVTSFKRKNYHTNAQWPGDPVSLLRRGWVVTDQIIGSPVAGSGAFLSASGQLSTSQARWPSTPWTSISPADAANFGVTVSDTRGIVRLKTYLDHASGIMRANTAVVHRDVAGVMTLRVKRIRGPYPVGLRQDRYCVSFWELVDG